MLKWINAQDKHRNDVQHLRKRALESQRAQMLMHIVFEHLGPALHLDSNAADVSAAASADGTAAVGPTPAPATSLPLSGTAQAAFELTIELIKFDVRCAVHMLQTFAQHVPNAQKPHGAAPASAGAQAGAAVARLAAKATCTELTQHYELLASKTGSDTRCQVEMVAAICSWFPTVADGESDSQPEQQQQ